MTIKELALNWIENDRTGDYSGREITLEEATNFVGYMDNDTLDELDEEITPEKFRDAWNEIIAANKIWYAVQRDTEDDWGTGSFDRDEAISMAKELREDYPDALVAVIQRDTCIDEIRDFD